ncbi:hypothetical protein ACFYE2_00400 [Kocuria sp. CPCC 205300]|uniref:hypothetical protein n=1 Tax=Kocuria sabuli TaxID=3071448 RepID=UPI0036DD56A4
MNNWTTFEGNRIHFHDIHHDVADAAIMDANSVSIASIMDVSERDLMRSFTLRRLDHNGAGVIVDVVRA